MSVPIIDPQTAQQFQGNQIPQARFSPVARAILANDRLYPLPNRPGVSNNLVTGSADKQRAHQGDVKVDANLSTADRFFGRFSTSTSPRSPSGPRSRAS